MGVPRRFPTRRRTGAPLKSQVRGGTRLPSQKIGVVGWVENGTHEVFGNRMAPWEVGEATLAEEVLPRLKLGMLCQAVRGFDSFHLWNLARETGAEQGGDCART